MYVRELVCMYRLMINIYACMHLTHSTQSLPWAYRQQDPHKPAQPSWTNEHFSASIWMLQGMCKHAARPLLQRERERARARERERERARKRERERERENFLRWIQEDITQIYAYIYTYIRICNFLVQSYTFLYNVTVTVYIHTRFGYTPMWMHRKLYVLL